MRATSLSHLGSQELIRITRTIVANDRAVTADLIWHLAEIDARRLYLEWACASMAEFCIRELGMSEDVAYKRIGVARVAREFPAVIDALAEGRLGLTAVSMLRSYLRPENASGLFAAAAGKTNAEIERLLAERFPQTESLPLVVAVTNGAGESLAVRRVEGGTELADSLAVRRVEGASASGGNPVSLPARRVDAPRSVAVPVAPQRYELRVMMSAETNDKLQHLRNLLGHQIPAGDLGEIVNRAFDALIREAEKTKCGATDRPQTKERPTTSRRHIPSRVKRAVWRRDGGQCTYLSADGRRCGCRAGLEFDHVTPVAHGGQATIENLRLRCRGHNQYEADRTFGRGFMERKREQARGSRAATSEPPCCS